MIGHFNSLREPLGLFAPDPNQGPEDPGPATGEITLLGISTVSACRAGVTESLRASGPRKLGKIRGESLLSPPDFPRLSPDAKHPGWRLRRRARSITASSQTSAFLFASAGAKLFLHNHAASAIEVQEMKSPGSGVQGAEEAPCSIITLHNKPVKN